MGCCPSKDNVIEVKYKPSKDKSSDAGNVQKNTAEEPVKSASPTLVVTSSDSSENEGQSSAWLHWRSQPKSYAKCKEFVVPIPSLPVVGESGFTTVQPAEKPDCPTESTVKDDGSITFDTLTRTSQSIESTAKDNSSNTLDTLSRTSQSIESTAKDNSSITFDTLSRTSQSIESTAKDNSSITFDTLSRTSQSIVSSPCTDADSITSERCYSVEPCASDVKELYPNFKFRSLTPSCEVQKKASCDSFDSEEVALNRMILASLEEMPLHERYGRPVSVLGCGTPTNPSLASSFEHLRASSPGKKPKFDPAKQKKISEQGKTDAKDEEQSMTLASSSSNMVDQPAVEDNATMLPSSESTNTLQETTTASPNKASSVSSLRSRSDKAEKTFYDVEDDLDIPNTIEGCDQMNISANEIDKLADDVSASLTSLSANRCIVPRPPSSPPTRKSCHKRIVRRKVSNHGRESSKVSLINGDVDSRSPCSSNISLNQDCSITDLSDHCAYSTEYHVSGTPTSPSPSYLERTDLETVGLEVAPPLIGKNNDMNSFEKSSSVYNGIFTPKPPPRPQRPDLKRTVSFRSVKGILTPTSRNRTPVESSTTPVGHTIASTNDVVSAHPRNTPIKPPITMAAWGKSETSSPTASVNPSADLPSDDYSLEDWDSYTSSPDIGTVSGTTSYCTTPELEIPNIPGELCETPALFHYKLESEHIEERVASGARIGSITSTSSMENSNQEEEGTIKVHRALTLEEKMEFLNRCDSDESIGYIGETKAGTFTSNFAQESEYMQSSDELEPAFKLDRVYSCTESLHSNGVSAYESEPLTVNTHSDNALQIQNGWSLENNGKYKLPRISPSAHSVKVKSKKKRKTKKSSKTAPTVKLSTSMSSGIDTLKSNFGGSRSDCQSSSEGSMGTKPTISGIKLTPLSNEDLTGLTSKPSKKDTALLPNPLFSDALPTRRKVLDPIEVGSVKKASKKSSKSKPSRCERL